MFRGFLCYVIIQEYLLLCHQPLFLPGSFLPRKYTDGDTRTVLEAFAEMKWVFDTYLIRYLCHCITIFK